MKYSSTYPVDTRKAENLLAANYRGNPISIPNPGSIIYYAVTAVDRYGNESAACQSHNENNSTGNRSSRFRRVLLPISNGNTIYLSSNDAPAGTLVQISTIMGNDIASCLAKEDYSQRGDYKYGRSYIDISHLTPGHYSLYLVNKKGYRHLLGSFSVPFK